MKGGDYLGLKSLMNTQEDHSYSSKIPQPRYIDDWRKEYFKEKEKEKDRLLYFIKENDEETLRYLTDDIKNWRNDKDYSLLHIAAENNDVQLINKLIEFGVDKDLMASMDSVTPLDVAAEKGHLEAIEAFIAHGGDINVECFSVIKAAEEYNKPELINFLIKKGFDINTKDSDGRTALHIVAFNNKYPTLIRALVASGADVKAVNNYGETALHLAVESYSDVDSIKALTEIGIDVNAVNQDNQTALHKVADRDRSDKKEIVDILIAAGADVNIQDNEGCTLLHLIINQSSIDEDIEKAVEALIAAGANVNLKNRNGETAQDKAKEKTFEESLPELFYKSYSRHDGDEENSVKRVKVGDLPDDEIYFVSPLQNILNRVEEKKKGLEK